MNRDNITQTCAEACQDEYGVGGCCVGANACDGFTGLVCRDADTSTGFMGSCSGTNACRNANIGSVFQSCAEGYDSCKDAGQNGYIGSMKGSCKGPRACTGAAANQDQLSAKMQPLTEARLVRLRTRASVNNRATILPLIKELLGR